MNIQRIGDILIERALISKTDLAQAKRLQEEVGGLVGQALIRLGALSEDDLLQTLSDQLQLPIIHAEALSTESADYERAMEILDLSPAWLALRQCAIWCDHENSPVHVIAHNILDLELRERLEAQSYAKNIELRDYLASNQTLEIALAQIKSHHNGEAAGASDDDAQRLRELAEGAPVIDFVNRVFSTALKENASDIHIEPFL